MIQRIGYACINTSIESNFRDCRLNSVYKNGIEFLKEISLHNLNLIKETLIWNIEHGILMYRTPSKLIPFGSHEGIINDFSFHWQEDSDILSCLNEISSIVKGNNVRISMHPDHFTVLNSPNEAVVKNSIINLEYHRDLITMMGGTDLIIHTGGVYGDKLESMNRFVSVYNSLEDSIKKCIRLENDDVSYSLEDVGHIYESCGVPILLDIHHHYCNNEELDISSMLNKVYKSWENTGLIPKCHISTGLNGYRDKRHHDYVSVSDFLSFCEIVRDIPVDIMVEAKAKELAVLALKKLIVI